MTGRIRLLGVLISLRVDIDRKGLPNPVGLGNIRAFHWLQIVLVPAWNVFVLAVAIKLVLA